MLAQLGQDRTHVETHGRQFLLRYFNEYFFVLNAKQLNLGHVFHAQDFLAHVVCKFFHFSGREAICLQSVNHTIDIAKVIDKERPHHAGRQGASHVTNLFADGVPNVGHIGWLGIVLDLENDLSFARLGIAANFVGEGNFLKRSLQFIGHLLSHLLSGGAWPIGPDHHHAKRERWIFVLA